MSTGKYRSIAQHGAATERVQRVMADGTSLASFVATSGTIMEVTELSNDAKKCEGCLAWWRYLLKGKVLSQRRESTCVPPY